VEEFPFNGYCHDTGCMKPDSWKNEKLRLDEHATPWRPGYHGRRVLISHTINA
jgi:hypothetical protein